MHRGMFSTSRDIIMNVGDTMCTSGDVQYIREISTLVYHEYIGGCSAHHRDIMLHLGEQLDKSFQFLLKTPMQS